MADDEIDYVDQEAELSREEAAKRLHAIADSLASRNGLDLEREGRRIFVRVPDRVRLSVEVEGGEDGTEVEIELSW
jgi:amphi-Trp domain-containing protein